MVLEQWPQPIEQPPSKMPPSLLTFILTLKFNSYCLLLAQDEKTVLLNSYFIYFLFVLRSLIHCFADLLFIIMLFPLFCPSLSEKPPPSTATHLGHFELQL